MVSYSFSFTSYLKCSYEGELNIFKLWLPDDQSAYWTNKSVYNFLDETEILLLLTDNTIQMKNLKYKTF